MARRLLFACLILVAASSSSSASDPTLEVGGPGGKALVKYTTCVSKSVDKGRALTAMQCMLAPVLLRQGPSGLADCWKSYHLFANPIPTACSLQVE